MTFGDNYKNLPSSFAQTNMTTIRGLIKEHNAKVIYSGTVNRQIYYLKEFMVNVKLGRNARKVIV